MLSYPSAMRVSTRALTLLTKRLSANRVAMRSPWRRLSPGRQALLVLAHLRKNETYAELAAGFGIGVATVCRYIHEALDVLAALAPTLDQALAVARGKAYVIIDGTLLRIDRVGMASGADRVYYSGKHKAHGVNVQVIADPAGRLIWISPALPGSCHDMGAATKHGITDAVAAQRITALGDSAYYTATGQIRAPLRSRRKDPTSDTGAFLPLSAGQKAVNTAHARMRAPGERVNAELKNWKVLRKIRSSPAAATTLVNAIQTLMIAST